MSGVSNIQVLLIDDHRPTLVMLKAMFRAAGLRRVAAAENTVEAFDILNASPIDLLVVDWRMRPIDGLEFTRLVRCSAHSPRPHVPILMLTAHTEESRVAAARDAGVNGFLRKPISAAILFERVSAALSDDRAFIRSENFCGPDRRRRLQRGYGGPLRRASDRLANDDLFDLDDFRVGA